MLQNKGFIPVQCSQLVTATAKSRGVQNGEDNLSIDNE